MAQKKQKANYSALFNTGAALQPGAFPKLEALTSAALSEEDETAVQILAIETLLDNPYQPRSTVDEEGLQQLTLTIQDQGFQGVLVARPHPTQSSTYQITAGHRRREAARRAGLISLPVVVKDIPDQNMAILSVTENIQREDLTPLDEGKMFCVMMELMGMTLEQVAEAVKKSESYVRNRRRVALAPEDIQLMVIKKPDSLRAVFYLLKVENVSARASIIDLILQGKLTADEVDQYVKTLEQHDAEQATEQARVETSVVKNLPSLSETADVKGTAEVASSPHTTEKPGSFHSSLQEASPSLPESSASELVVFEKHMLVGVSKLKTLLKAMKTYAEAASVQHVLSSEEIELVDQIIEVAQQIRQVSVQKRDEQPG